MFQVAIEAIGPLMVGTDEQTDRSLARLPQARAAMTAHVAVSANDVVVVADNDDRGPADIDCRDVARLAYIG